MTGGLDQAQAEEAIIAALAAAQEKTPAALRDELLAAGAEMSIDSLDTVEIMLALEEQFGIRFPDSTDTCEAFQSVARLAELVRQLVDEAESEEAG